MDHILDRLWLGDFEDAERVTLEQCTAVMTLCEQKPLLTSAHIAHWHTPIPDEVYLPPHAWSELVHKLTQMVRDEDAVLVHCRLGVSRSPALIAAYLAQCGYTLEHALAYLVSVRSVVCPHSETWRGLQAWWEPR